MKPSSARNELREKWPRRVARRLRDWLDGYLGDIDRPDEFAGGEDVPEAPPLPENAFLDSAGGPPADWLDRVRKGAPQLLVQPSEGGVPWQSAAQASSDRMPEWVAPEADRGILKPVADTRVVPEQRKRHGIPQSESSEEATPARKQPMVLRLLDAVFSEGKETTEARASSPQARRDEAVRSKAAQLAQARESFEASLSPEKSGYPSKADQPIPSRPGDTYPSPPDLPPLTVSCATPAYPQRRRNDSFRRNSDSKDASRTEIERKRPNVPPSEKTSREGAIPPPDRTATTPPAGPVRGAEQPPKRRRTDSLFKQAPEQRKAESQVKASAPVPPAKQSSRYPELKKTSERTPKSAGPVPPADLPEIERSLWPELPEAPAIPPMNVQQAAREWERVAKLRNEQRGEP